MEIDILRLLNKDNFSLEGCLEFDYQNENFKDFILLKPAKISYVAACKNSFVEFSYKVNIFFRTECSRCLEVFEQSFEFQDSCIINNKTFETNYPELPISKMGKLDLKEFCFQEIVLNVFPIFVCSENCQGLCCNCGNLKKECSCSEEPKGDPRMQILKQLLTPNND